MDLNLYLSARPPAALPSEQALAEGLAEEWPSTRQVVRDRLGRHVRRFYLNPNEPRGLEATYQAGDEPTLVVDLHAPRQDVVRLVEWLREHVPGQALDVLLQIESEVDQHELRSQADLEQLLDTAQL